MQANNTAKAELLLTSLTNFHHAIHAAAHHDEHADRGALKLLAYINAHRIQRLSELPKEFPLDLSTISRHCAALTRDGLLDRSDDPTDRRAVLMKVTKAGHEELERLRLEKAALLKDAIADWSSEDIENFARLLDRMSEDFGKFAKSERASHRPESK